MSKWIEHNFNLFYTGLNGYIIKWDSIIKYWKNEDNTNMKKNHHLDSLHSLPESVRKL